MFTKIYFSGLDYQSLRDSLADFNRCVEAITEVVDIEGHEGDGPGPRVARAAPAAATGAP